MHMYLYVKFCAVLFSNSRAIHESVTTKINKLKNKTKKVISRSMSSSRLALKNMKAVQTIRAGGAAWDVAVPCC